MRRKNWLELIVQISERSDRCKRTIVSSIVKESGEHGIHSLVCLLIWANEEKLISENQQTFFGQLFLDLSPLKISWWTVYSFQPKSSSTRRTLLFHLKLWILTVRRFNFHVRNCFEHAARTCGKSIWLPLVDQTLIDNHQIALTLTWRCERFINWWWVAPHTDVDFFLTAAGLLDVSLF